MKLSKLLSKLNRIEVPDIEVFCYDETNDIYYDPIKLDYDDEGNINIVIEEI